MASRATKVKDTGATDPENPGLIAADSLAAESKRGGGAFSSNPNSEPIGVEGSKSTLANTDTSGATVLDPAADAEARMAQNEWDEEKRLGSFRTGYADAAGGQAKDLAGTNTRGIGGQAGNPTKANPQGSSAHTGNPKGGQTQGVSRLNEDPLTGTFAQSAHPPAKDLAGTNWQGIGADEERHPDGPSGAACPCGRRHGAELRPQPVCEESR